MKQIRDALATRPERPDSPLKKDDEADDVRYPIIVGDKLTLTAGPAMRRGELVAPTLAGWRQYLDLAARGGLRHGELQEVATHYWERRVPRGTVKAAGEKEALEAPARRPEALLPEPAAPSPAPQVPLTWADKVIARFNRAPGYTLRLVRRSGQDQHVFALEREGRAGDVIASIDVAAGEVEDVRWLDPRVRSAEQTDIVDRLAGILVDLQAEESAAERRSAAGRRVAGPAHPHAGADRRRTARHGREAHAPRRQQGDARQADGGAAGSVGPGHRVPRDDRGVAP
jgi:hypothetical protein